MGSTMVVFDLDGVLVDSREANVEAFSYGLEQIGLPRPERQRVTDLIGRPALDMLARLGCPEERCAEVLQRFVTPRYIECLPVMARAMPGARETLARLTSDGCLVGVCTSGALEVQKPVLEGTGLMQFVQRIQTPCRSRYRKPDPRYLHELVQEFSAPYRRLFHVEDTEEGVMMGRLGGAVTIFAHYGYGTVGEESPDFQIHSVDQVADIVST